jgi:hypothetical protein
MQFNSISFSKKDLDRRQEKARFDFSFAFRNSFGELPGSYAQLAAYWNNGNRKSPSNHRELCAESNERPA